MTTSLGSNYQLSFLDSSQNELSSIGFDLDFEIEQFFSDEVVVTTTQSAPFSISTEFPANTASIVLYQGQNILWQTSRTPNKPVLSISDVVVKNNTISTKWNVTDKDGDLINTTVLYSPDGSSIVTIASDITDTMLVFNIDKTNKPQDGSFIEVYASDGFNYAVDKKEISLPTLTIVKAGKGGGSVMSIPSGINCGTECSQSFEKSTVITLTVTADAGSSFAGWTGGECSESAACSFSIVTDTVVTATFSKSNSGTVKKPDIAALKIKTLKKTKSGRKIRIKTVFTNKGEKKSPAVKVDFYLSTDKNLLNVDNDMLFGKAELKKIKVNKKRTVTAKRKIPKKTAPGKYFIKAIADSTGKADELDKNNNRVLSRKIKIR